MCIDAKQNPSRETFALRDDVSDWAIWAPSHEHCAQSSLDLLALKCQLMLLNSQSRIRPAKFSYSAGQIEAEHTHAEHQLVYASVGLFCVDTALSRWVVPPLRAVWVPALTPHAITARVDSEMSTLYVDAATIPANLDTVAVVSVSPLLRELILHITGEPLTEPAQKRIEAVLLDQLAADPARPLQVRRLVDERLRAIAGAFEVDPCDRRTLRELGADVGASERTLQRLFKAETGSSFGRWRTQVRLQCSIIELGKGRSVTEAASRSGYRETSAFIAAFRSAFGTTPGRYFS